MTSIFTDFYRVFIQLLAWPTFITQALYPDTHYFNMIQEIRGNIVIAWYIDPTSSSVLIKLHIKYPDFEVLWFSENSKNHHTLRRPSSYSLA